MLAQILDYVKEVVTKDLEWFEHVWQKFCKDRGINHLPLLELMSQKTEGDFDEAQFFERLELSLRQGNVIGLIVGDGISCGLQNLVSFLCRDSAHLKYSLGLVALKCFQTKNTGEILVLPELVQEVEAVQRAYVKIELDDKLQDAASVVSVVEDAQKTKSVKRTTLSEEAFWEELSGAIDKESLTEVKTFVDGITSMGIEADFKSSAMMLKMPDPNGESVGASLLAIEKKGRAYNPKFGLMQVKKWGWSDEASDRTIGEYWRHLNKIDRRFSDSGMGHLKQKGFLPLEGIIDKLDDIKEAIRLVVDNIEAESND